MNNSSECIAITGAAGFIGTQLVERLSQRGDQRLRLLVHVNLNVELPESRNISISHGDLLKSDTLDDFPETGCVVVNLAYLGGRPLEENLTAIENLLVACKRAKIKRLIHCSTAIVSGRVGTNKITENTSENPMQEYEVIKSRVERLILEKSAGVFEAVILRPTAVFGKGGRNLIKLMEDLRHGNRAVNYLKSCIYQYRRMNLVCIDNVVSAIEFLIRTNRNIGGETFIISDDADPSNNYRDIEKYLMRKMDCKTYFVPPVSLPLPILRALLRLSGRTNDNPDLVYDCGKIISAGFKKPVSFKEGLSRFSDWYIKTHFPDQHHDGSVVQSSQKGNLIKNSKLSALENISNTQIKTIACVTGGTGIIGSRIVHFLMENGYKVRSLSRKPDYCVPGVEHYLGGIEDENVLEAFVSGAAALFHCAAELNDETRMWDVNVLGTERLLSIAKDSTIKYLCYLSSSGVVGRTNIKWVDEKTKCKPHSVYERSKWKAEQLFSKGIDGCQIVILRPTNVIDNEHPGAISLLINGSRLSRLKVFLKGGECAHIVHAEDIAEAALYFISRPFKNPQCYFVSYDNEPMDTFAGLWALCRAVENNYSVDNVRPVPHLPLIIPFLLRKIWRGGGNRGDVRYSSRKLISEGFNFSLGINGTVKKLVSIPDSR